MFPITVVIRMQTAVPSPPACPTLEHWIANYPWKFSPHLGQKSAGLTLNLPSNNPFRNNAASPVGATSPASPFDDPPPRPLSRNPFLDPALTSRSSLSNIRSASETMPLEKRPSLTAEEIFVRPSLSS